MLPKLIFEELRICSLVPKWFSQNRRAFELSLQLLQWMIPKDYPEGLALFAAAMIPADRHHRGKSKKKHLSNKEIKITCIIIETYMGQQAIVTAIFCPYYFRKISCKGNRMTLVN